MDLSNLSINNMQKELTKYHSPIKMAAILVSAKVSVFTARSTRLSPSLPNGSTWHKH